MQYVTQQTSTNDSGVIITIGIQCGADPAAVVFPMCAENPPSDPNQICADAVAAVVAHLSDALALLSTDATVTHIAACGMVDGMTPARNDLPSGIGQGSGGDHVVPQQVAVLTTFYQDANDAFSESKPLRIGHCYWPGAPVESFTNGLLESSYMTSMEAFWKLLCETGISSDGGTAVWRRYLSVPFVMNGTTKTRPPGTNVQRVGALVTRGYPATQRRRLLPHP